MLRPTGDRVLVERVESPYHGRIVLPETVSREGCLGRVLSVGPGYRDEDGDLVPTTIKPGEYIVFGRYGALDLDFEGKKCAVVAERAVWGLADGPDGIERGPVGELEAIWRD